MLIIGAGPVGLSMASELTRHGVPCRILDKSSGPASQSRALAIFPRTLEIFDQIGIIAPVLEAGRKVYGGNIYVEADKIAHIGLENLDSPYPFVISLPQSDLERILIDHLARAGIEIEWQAELTGCMQAENKVTATLRHPDGYQKTLVTPWLIGCDGAHSAVRQAVGLPFAGEREDEIFVLADVEINWPFSTHEIHLFFHRDGPLGIIPLPDEGMCRIVASQPPGKASQVIKEPTLAEVQALVETRAPLGLQLRNPLWISQFHISYRKVPNFRRERVFLAGDAAHIHSPVGGQGMNTGIQDAHNLAWKLALVRAQRSPDSLLDSYQAEREPVARSILHLTDRVTQAVTLRNPLIQQLRNLILAWLTGIETVEHRIAVNLAELTLTYSDSPIVEEQWDGLLAGLRHEEAPVAGGRAPDGLLHALPTGEPVRLFELLQEPRHILLLFEGSQSTLHEHQPLEAIDRMIRANYAPDIVPYLIVTDKDTPPASSWAGRMLFDAEQVLHHCYGADHSCLYLIRPDGYVGFRSLPAQGDNFQEYLSRIFL